MTTRPMAGFDSLMWGLEQLPRMRSWIVAGLVLDGPVDPDELRDRLVQVADAVPRLRSVAAPSPRPFAARRWHEHQTLDVDAVLRTARLGDAEVGTALAGLMAGLADEAYEPGSPVWSVTVVDGLAGGRTALLFRLHHSVTDGVGAMLIAGLFFDADEQGTRLLAPPPVPVTDEGGDGWARQAVASVREDLTSAVRIGTHLARAALPAAARAAGDPVGAVRGAGAYAMSLSRLTAPAPTPLSPVLRGSDARTAAALLTVPVADLKAAARRTGGSLNDVFVAGVVAGLRRYHERLGAGVVPALRVYVPVSTRPAGGGADDGLGGNRFTPLRVEVPLAGDTPGALVAAVRARLAAGRGEPALGSGAAITELMGRLPGAVAGRLVSGMFYGLDVVATNVPGPPVGLWVAGRRAEALYALAPRSGAALCVTLLSYGGTAYLTVNHDRGAVSDPDLMTRCLDEGLRWVVGEGVGEGAG